MKHIKIYEDFDLEKFLEDPNSEFHDDSNPEIEIGDWVTSYRGPGQLLSINNDIARVQLISGSSAIILVPFSALNKITKAEAAKISKDLPDTQKEIKKMATDMEAIMKASVSDDEETGEEIFTGNLEKTVAYLEDFLVDAIDLKNKDPYSPYYKEYGSFTSQLTNICYLLLDFIGKSMESTGSPTELASLKNYRDRMEKIQDKFFEISE